MGKPEIPKRMSKNRRVLLEKAMAYICDTNAQTAAIQQNILKESDHDYIGIKKLSDRYSSVGKAGPATAKWEGEAREELFLLLQQAIIKKGVALTKKITADMANQLILLLYDAYGFCGRQEVYEACQRVMGKEKFHSIYWASSFANRPNILYPDSPGRNGFFIFSKNSEWMKE